MRTDDDARRFCISGGAGGQDCDIRRWAPAATTILEEKLPPPVSRESGTGAKPHGGAGENAHRRDVAASTSTKHRDTVLRKHVNVALSVQRDPPWMFESGQRPADAPPQDERTVAVISHYEDLRSAAIG